MASVTVDDIRNFAERVERFCDYILGGMEKDGSEDVVAIQKIKEDAADLQVIKKNSNVSIEGLSDHMKGL